MFTFATWRTGSDELTVVYQKIDKQLELASYFISPQRVAGQLVESGCYFKQLKSLLDALESDPAGPSHVVVCKNQHVVLGTDYLHRCSEALRAISTRADRPWMIATPSGLCRDDERVISSYYSHLPRLPTQKSGRYVLDTFIDLYFVNMQGYSIARGELPSNISEGLELALINLGYMEGRASLLVPKMSCPVDGMPLSRDLARVSQDLEAIDKLTTATRSIPTLMGQLDFADINERAALPLNGKKSVSALDKAVQQIVWERAEKRSISIVVRTCFKRVSFLNRLLATLWRAQIDAMSLQIVLSTDIDAEEAQARLTEIKNTFSGLEIDLKVNSVDDNSSRVRNLLGGIAACSGEYVWIIDDDDYVSADAFARIYDTLAEGGSPLIFSDSAIVKERWHSDDSVSVLEQSVPADVYPGSRWRYLFAGANQIPVCGFICPTEHLKNQLTKVPFNHNLSEDYALVLGILASASLPPVMVINQPIAYISVREDGDNTVTMLDRRPWTEDIHGFLYDMMSTESIASEGFWNLLVNRSSLETPLDEHVKEQLGNTILKLREENRALRKSNRLVENELKDARMANTKYVRPERRSEPEIDLPLLHSVQDESNQDGGSEFLKSA